MSEFRESTKKHKSFNLLIRYPLAAGFGISLVSLIIYACVAGFFNANSTFGYVVSFIIPFLTATPIHYVLRYLFRSIDKKTLVIQAQKNHLEEVLKSRDELLRIIVHDIKSPINNLQSSLELLKEKEIEIDFFIQQMLPEIEEKIKKTNLLIDEFVEWAIFQSKKSVNLQPVNIAEIILEVIAGFEPMLDEKKLSIKFKNNCLNCMAMGDSRMLKAILRNVISNAVKFSFEETNIEIILSKNQELEIEVIDHGTGMSEQKIQTILNSDDVISSTPGTRQEKGTGLGLKLVKRLLEHQHGSLKIVSTEKKGTSTKILIPAA